MHYCQQIPEVAAFMSGANHVDVKTVEGDVSLRQFIASMMAYQPGWVSFLYGVRMVFVRFLGMTQKGIPQPPHLSPADVPMQVGKRLAIFKVCAAKEDAYMVAEAADDHLIARLGVAAEPLANGQTRFHVLTIVHYNNWAGPVYFNVIRPFHHLVVGGMARAGISRA